MIQDFNGKILVSSTTDLHVSDLIMDELFKETKKKKIHNFMRVWGLNFELGEYVMFDVV
jgi:hypothetical protein